MSDIFEQMAGLDKLLHEPARLAILTALSACQSADYTFLQRITHCDCSAGRAAALCVPRPIKPLRDEIHFAQQQRAVWKVPRQWDFKAECLR